MNRSLLVIDDNKSVRDSLRFLLERRGYEVLTAESGSEGIAFSNEYTVDGVLLDVNMPGMNGLAVCRTLSARATESGRRVPIWMMTGARTPELTKACVEAGALMLLAKPFDFGELFRCLDEALGPMEPPPPGADVPGAE